jgi:hypothetical protein
MRIYLLRILIASWMIPFSWIIIFPISILFSGSKIAIGDIVEFNETLWNGF